MKVYYDAQIFRQQRYGGISRYFCEIAPRVARLPGVAARIVAPRHQNAYLAALPVSLKWGWQTMSRGDLIQRRCQQIVEQAAMSLGKPDLVHETYFWGSELSTRAPARVLTIYDMIHERFADMFPSKDKTIEAKRAAALRADHVICISHSTRRDVIDMLGIQSAKTSVTHLAAKLPRPQAHVPRQTAGASVPYILYVGERGRYKNFDALLQAVQASPMLRRLRLVCFGGRPFSSEESALHKRMDLSSAHLLHTDGTDGELAAMYAGALCFVYPSLFEGFGIPPLEAMLNDCPVVCSRTSSMPEVVGEAGAYFDPSDPADIARVLEDVVNSEVLRATLRAKGRSQAKLFSWDRCAAETAAIYGAITKKSV